MRYVNTADLKLLKRYGCTPNSGIEDLLRVINIAELRRKDIQDLHKKIEELGHFGDSIWDDETVDKVSKQSSQ